MLKSIDTPNASEDTSAAAAPPEQGSRDGDAAELRAHIDAFRRELEHHDRDFERLAAERAEAGRQIACDLADCKSWDDLVAFHAAWAQAKGEVCQLEARWLVLYADLIRRPASPVR